MSDHELSVWSPLAATFGRLAQTETGGEWKTVSVQITGSLTALNDLKYCYSAWDESEFREGLAVAERVHLPLA